MDQWELRNQLDELTRQNAELSREIARLKTLIASMITRMEIASYETKRDMHNDKTDR